MTKGEAEGILSGILRPINEGTVSAAKPSYTFGQFVESVYLPHCRRTWKASTAFTTENTITTHLVPAFRDRVITSIGRDEMQGLLDSKASLLSKPVVTHLRWYLSAVFKLAVSDGIMGHNPAAELRIPKTCKSGRKVRALTGEEVNQYIGAIDLPERLMARLAIFEGFRPGEVLALKWGAVDGSFLGIRQRVYDGVLDTPKNGKEREAAMSDGTFADLEEWRSMARSTAPGAFVFPSEKFTTPVSMKNVWRRSIEPRLKPLGLDWATFQVLRKTNATLSQKAHVDAKVSADQRGHGLGVSMEVYTHSDREQKLKAVKKLESSVARKRKPRLSA